MDRGEWACDPPGRAEAPHNHSPQPRTIDLDSPILPGLDDGPQTLEECVAMLRMAALNGDPIEPEPQPEPAQPSKWYRFWKPPASGR